MLETYGSTDFDVLETVRNAVLRMTHYWYNFMPLSRGTAVVCWIHSSTGIITRCQHEIHRKNPTRYNWEAILNTDPNSFIDSIISIARGQNIVERLSKRGINIGDNWVYCRCSE